MPTPIEEASFAELVVRFGRLSESWSGSLTNLQNLVSLITMAGGRWWLDKATMDADLIPNAGTPAVVYGDPVQANNGVYVKTAISGVAGWSATGFLFGSTIPLALLAPDVFEAFRADVTQVIGRTGVPVAGNPVAGSAYIQAVPVAHASPLARLPVKLVAPGDLMVARYIVNGDATQIRRQETAVIAVADIGDGNKVFTQADFGVINFNPGDLIGLSGDGMFTASPDFPVDGPGWRQINPLLDDWRPMPALQVAIRLEYSAEFDQHIQVVNGPDFLAVKAQAAEVDARATELEAQVADLWTDRVQVIGNADALVPGDGVAGGLYVWADPNEHPGPLLSLDIMPAAAGDFDLVKEYRVDNKLYRNLLVTLTAAAADVEQRFLPEHFGDIVVAEGEHLALHGPGVIAATSEPADGSGFWDVPGWPATPRNIPAPSTGNRLQARFRVQQQYQAATADAVVDLQDRVADIEADFESVVGSPLFDGAMLGSPDWLSLTKANFKAPLRGGLVGQSLKRFQGRRTLAHLATVADTYNGAALGHSNVASDLAFCGASSLRLHTVGAGGNPVPTAPAAANPFSLDVRGGIIQFEFRPVLNVGDGLDRWWMELHSPGSTPDNPSVNHHRIPIGSNSWLKGLLTSTALAGRNQSSAIPVSCFTPNGAGADLSAITWARFMTRAANGQTVEIEYGNIDWVPNPLSEGRLIVCGDDGYIEQITWLAPQLRKRGMRGMLYPSPPAILVDVSGSYANHNHLFTLQDRHGWQMACQAWKSEAVEYWDPLDRNGKVAEFGKLFNWRAAMGFAGGAHGSNFSTVDMRYLPIFEAQRIHFRSNRGYFNGNYNPADLSAPPFPFPEVYPWGDPMNIRALNAAGVTNANNGAWLIAHIQQAIDHKAVAKLVLHKEWVANANVQAGVIAALDFAAAKQAVGQLKVCTEEDLHYGYAV